MFYGDMIRRVEAALKTKYPCLGEYARPLATLIVLCSQWEVGDALAGVFLIKIIKSVSEKGVDTARRVKEILESCGVRVQAEPDQAMSRSHDLFCLYLRIAVDSSDLDQDVKRIMQLLATYSRHPDQETLREIDRALESIGAKVESVRRYRCDWLNLQPRHG